MPFILFDEPRHRCEGCPRWDDGQCDGEPEHCTAKEFTPEQQIDNVLRSLSKLVNGSAHRYRMDAIRSTVAQLEEM